jgi:diguanylate cyclase (GGDEF)-like protein
LAFFDQLTGVPNRTLLLDRLKQSVAGGSRSGSCGALLFIDLDHFKTLNDTLGHAMGDLLLQQVAQRLAYCVREGDTVARLSGDEFVVILEGLGADEIDAAASAKIVAEKILDALSQPYPLGDVAYRSTASVGITLFSVDPITPDELMMQADLAMYRSKAAGRNTIHFFDSHMESEIKERAALEVDLLRAIEERQFLLHYQAQNMSDGRVTGAEVLVRWLHPQRGLVSPAEFIPLAEETGLILPLGQWVLKTACTQLAIWAAQPEMAHLTVAVNVSARQFQANFVDQVLAVLDSTGANPERLKIELTESMLVENVKDIIAKMVALKATGVGFSLDDFGTGYSSLAYLAQLPINQIKIDSSFVGNIPGKESDETIARTIITMSRELGIDVIAEGVETEAQRKFLEFHGCHAFQGYLFSRPLPVREFEKIVKRA